MNEKIHTFKEKVNVLSESFDVIEEENKVIIQGLALTFEKPTRNRVSYSTESGKRTHKSLVGKPFLDSHKDESIHTHPPFGHVIETWIDVNPNNGLPALYYKVDIDPEEKDFIRKCKRGDVCGVSVQVLVDDVTEKQDMYGKFIHANIREFLELSAVLIPGDGDTTIRFIEKVNKKLNTNISLESMDTTNGSALIGTDGVLPKSKVIRKDPETENPDDDTIKSKIYKPNPMADEEDDENKDEVPNQSKRLIGKKMENENIDTKKYEELFSKMEELYNKMSEKDKEVEVSKESFDYSKIESMIKSTIKEELKGTPERDTSKKEKPIEPGKQDSMPNTNQPANGVAPSGGTLRGDDDYGDYGEDETKDYKKPKTDYDKSPIKKNSLDEARTLMEKAKAILKEYKSEDSGIDEQVDKYGSKEPEEMDMSSPKKEVMENDDVIEDEKKKEEGCGMKKEESANPQSFIEQHYNKLKEEMAQSNRKSINTAPIKTTEGVNQIKSNSNTDVFVEYLKSLRIN